MTTLLAYAPRPLLGTVLAVLALVEAFMLLMTYLVLEKLLATGPDAEEERLWNNLTWDVGVFFILLSALGGLVVFVVLRAFLNQRRHTARRPNDGAAA
jgi:hypothetical protein